MNEQAINEYFEKLNMELDDRFNEIKRELQRLYREEVDDDSVQTFEIAVHEFEKAFHQTISL